MFMRSDKIINFRNYIQRGKYLEEINQVLGSGTLEAKTKIYSMLSSFRHDSKKRR
jgi:hypothetical protein